MTAEPKVPTYKKKDFMSDQTVRWCPGCGDYSILSQVQTTFAELGIPRENFAVISGIGCSSRFPYYMNTYGFHTIHGRAPAFATGLKIANPELSVWVVTGDGDALSIGGNHLIHVLRRNVDLNIMLFNNQIYGLTKGQYSPTSEVGKRTKSSPMGSLDNPFLPLQVALGAQSTFIARTVDVFPKHLRQMLKEAEAHRGTSFIEIYQNCNIFNDGAFAEFTDRKVRDDQILYLKHGEPMLFGKSMQKGLVLDGLSLRVVTIGDGATKEDCLVHDETNLTLAWLLSQLSAPEFPVPVGVLRRISRPTYDAGVYDQISQSKQKLGQGDIAKLITSGDTWNVG